MLSAVMLVVIISMSMILLRVVMGSSIFDRLLGVNSLNTHIIIFIVMLSLIENSSYYFKYKPEDK